MLQKGLYWHKLWSSEPTSIFVIIPHQKKMRLDSSEKFLFKEWSNIFLWNVWGSSILTTVGTWGVSTQLQLTNISISNLGRSSRIFRDRGIWRRLHHFPPKSYYLKNEIADSSKSLLIGESNNKCLRNFAAWWISWQILPKFCYLQKRVTVSTATLISSPKLHSATFRKTATRIFEAEEASQRIHVLHYACLNLLFPTCTQSHLFTSDDYNRPERYFVLKFFEKWNYKGILTKNFNYIHM